MKKEILFVLLNQLNFTDPAQKRSVRHINDILCQKTQKDWITNIPNLLVCVHILSIYEGNSYS